MRERNRVESKLLQARVEGTPRLLDELRGASTHGLGNSGQKMKNKPCPIHFTGALPLQWQTHFLLGKGIILQMSSGPLMQLLEAFRGSRSWLP